MRRCLKVHYRDLEACLNNDDFEKLFGDFIATVKLAHKYYKMKARGQLFGRHTMLEIIKNAHSEVLDVIAVQLRNTPWFNVIETDDFFGPLTWKEGMEE